MAEGQHWQNARSVFEGWNFHALSPFTFLVIYIERYGCYLSNAIRITSFRPLELKLCTKHRLDVKFTFKT
jgi:hypothetical protein